MSVLNSSTDTKLLTFHANLPAPKMLIKEFVSLLRNYHDAGKNASGTYEGEQTRVAELS